MRSCDKGKNTGRVWCPPIADAPARLWNGLEGAKRDDQGAHADAGPSGEGGGSKRRLIMPLGRDGSNLHHCGPVPGWWVGRSHLAGLQPARRWLCGLGRASPHSTTHARHTHHQATAIIKRRRIAPLPLLSSSPFPHLIATAPLTVASVDNQHTKDTPTPGLSLSLPLSAYIYPLSDLYLSHDHPPYLSLPSLTLTTMPAPLPIPHISSQAAPPPPCA